MSPKILTVFLLYTSILIAGGYKFARNLYGSFQKNIISEQICRASEARLQVGATREVVDFAKATLIASGYNDAEIQLKTKDAIFSETNLKSESAQIYNCSPEGITGVELSIYFPKAKIITTDLFVAFILALIVLWNLKFVLFMIINGALVKVTNEFSKMIYETLRVEQKITEKIPFWMSWLQEQNPKMLTSFTNHIKALEYKIDRQTKDLQSQAMEKATKESQLIEARKFKDFVHQVRHDLRQTVGVVQSSLELMPQTVGGHEVLKRAIVSLDTMINNLKVRELKHEDTSKVSADIIEVIVAEIAREQQIVFLSEKIKINYTLDSKSLHFVTAPREELRRVITNLIVNSAEAIHNEGKIDIVSLSSEKEFCLKIIDNGEGFSEEALKNLFKKGFTTKESGSGLGLSYAQKKIREWGGKILVISRLGRTEIEIFLPCVATNDWVHPSVISSVKNLVIVDDHPLNLKNNYLDLSHAKIYESLKSFEAACTRKSIRADELIVFDLHLEEGRKATEVLKNLEPNQDYVFMTSDYLNPELMEEASRRNFLIIPKELIHFGLSEHVSLREQDNNYSLRN